MKISILIPARNEAGVIQATLERLLDEGLLPGQIHLIADYCQDATPQIAASLGVRVWERNDSNRVGKGPAISWWLGQSDTEADPGEIIIILDADTGLERGLVDEVAQAFERGAQIAQTRIEPRRLTDSHVALLASFSEKVEQHIYDAIRHRLGWSVRLRGTGMAFRREVLQLIASDLRTSVEDIELTILALKAGHKIEWIESTCIYDPKPVNADGAARQRARWLKGQFEVLRLYWPQILVLLMRGFGQMSLVGSLFLKPRTLFLPFKLILACLLTWAVSQLEAGFACWLIPAALLWLNLAFELTAMLYGLRTVENPWATLRALMMTPLFGLIWLRSAALALFSKEAWLRGRSTGFAENDIDG